MRFKSTLPTHPQLTAEHLMASHQVPQHVAPDLWQAVAHHHMENLEAVGEHLPCEDLYSSPFGVRAAALGLSRGHGFYHHEARVRLAMPAGLEPPGAVWEHGDRTTPVWQDGVLHEPKYFSFFLDAPLAAFNPNHRSKWRSHELLHSAVGFFWHPEQTPFEAYLGARLCELLPVVHWYGFDEVGRPRCPEHRGVLELIPKHTCPKCEQAGAGEEVDQERSKRRFEQGVEHFNAEWAVVMEELHTGRIVRRPTSAMLNASSDALGYMQSHWPRTTSWSFGTWMEMFMRRGEDFHGSVWELARRVAEVTCELLGGEVSFASDHVVRRRRRRVIQDLGYRVLLGLESLPVDAQSAQDAEAELMEVLGRLATWCHKEDEALGDEAAIAVDLSALYETYARVMRGYGSAVPSEAQIKAVGHQWLGAGGASLEVEQVAQGLEAYGASEDDASALIKNTSVFVSPGLLVSRFAEHLAKCKDPRSGQVALHAWAMEGPHHDEEAEWFGSLPQDASSIGAEDLLRVHHTWRTMVVSSVDAFELFGLEFPEPEVELGGFYLKGELCLVQVDDGMRQLLEELESGGGEFAQGLLLELIQMGAVVWLPSPRDGRDSLK